MDVIENHQSIRAHCNECLKDHESYSGTIDTDEGVFSEYLICIDPIDSNKFFLFIKLYRKSDYIVCGLLVTLEEQAVLTYMNKFPLDVEGFNWLVEALPRETILEKGFDEIVFGIFKDILIKQDSRISSLLKNWSEQ